jgi:hypothetical protein
MACSKETSSTMCSSLARSKSAASLSQACWRKDKGAITESTPIKRTLRKMNGMTVVGKSMPWAKPHAATAPP